LIRIMKYELKRLLLNRFYIGFLVINGLFAWYILTSDTIAGAAYTAPFSPWSFGSYVANVMPITMLAVLFLLTFFYSKNEKQTAALTSATPVDTVRYTLIRIAVIALGLLFLLTLIIGLSVFFYIYLFSFTGFSGFIVPALVIVLPCFVFFTGLGYFAGLIHPLVLYALMPVTLAISFVPIPNVFDIFGKYYFSDFPLTLPPGADGEPIFGLSPMFLVSRAIYFIAGVVLGMVSIFRNVHKEVHTKH